MAKGNTLGGRLAQERREKAVRDRKDIDQRSVAKAVGVSGSTYSRYEADLTKPDDDTLGRLADYFGCTRGWLRFGEGERANAPRSRVDVKVADLPEPKTRRVAGKDG